MPNIQLNYLYRCAGNYKNFGQVIFSNPNNRTPQDVTTLIKPTLWDGEFFKANEWHLPDLHFPKCDEELDHPFHEFESIEATGEPATEGRSIEEFLTRLAALAVVNKP